MSFLPFFEINLSVDLFHNVESRKAANQNGFKPCEIESNNTHSKFEACNERKQNEDDKYPDRFEAVCADARSIEIGG